MYPASPIKSNPGTPVYGIPFFLLTDETGQIQGASESFQHFTGSPQQQLIGGNISTFLSEIEFTNFQTFIESQSQGLSPVSCSIVVTGKEAGIKANFQVRRRRLDSNLIDWSCITFEQTPPFFPQQENSAPWFVRFFEHSAEPVFIYNATDLSVLFTNDAALQVYGYQGNELLNNFLYDHEQTTKDATNGNPYLLEPGSYTLLSREGMQVSVQVFTSPIDIEGKPHCLVFGTHHSILDAHHEGPGTVLNNDKSEQENLDMIVASMDDVVFEYDAEGLFRKAWCRNEAVLNLIPRQFLGRSMQEAFRSLPDFVAPFIEDFELSLSRKEIAYRDFSLLTGDATRWFNSKISPLYFEDGSPKGFIQRITDISEQKKVELAIESKNAELKETHRQLGEIIEHASDIIFKLDVNGCLIFVSPEISRSLGFTTRELQGKYFGTVVHPDDISLCEKILGSLRVFGNEEKAVVCRLCRKDGTFKWYSISVVYLFNEHQQPEYSIGFAKDVTELQQLVESLQATEARYTAFINHSTEGIWRFEPGKPLPVTMAADDIINWFMQEAYLAECNDAMAKQYGFASAEELSGVSLHQLMPIEDQRNYDFLHAFITNGFRLLNAESFEVDKLGNKKYFLNNLFGIVENEMLIRVWGTQRDITEQREAEERIRYLASIVDNVTDAIFSCDLELKIVTWNKAAETIHGLKPHEVQGRKLSELRNYHYQDTDRMIMLQTLEDKGEWKGEMVFTNETAQRSITLLATVSRLRNNAGKTIGYINVSKDITERKDAEKRIRESEERFRLMADTAPVMIWETNEKDETVYVNKSWQYFTGNALVQLTNSGWAGIVHQDDQAIAIKKYKEHFELRQPVVMEYRLLHNSGVYRWVVDNGVPRFLEDGAFLGYIGSVMDIHDRKEAEEKIRYQALVLQDISDVIISTNLDFTIIAWNRAAEEVYGFTAAEAIGKNIRELVDHVYFGKSREVVLEELFRNDQWEGDTYFDRKDGRRIYVSMRLSFVKNEKGERIGFAGIHRDITSKRDSELALLKSELQYRSLVDALGEGIMMVNIDGIILTCNQSAEKILGQPREQLIGSKSAANHSILVRQDGIPLQMEKYPSFITLKTGQAIKNKVLGVTRPDTTICWVSINTEPVYYSGEKLLPDAVVISFVDITEKIKAQNELLAREQQLREYSERISSILDSITDGFLAVDDNLNILLWNHVFEKATGKKAEEVIGCNINAVFPELVDKKLYQVYVTALKQKTSVSFEAYSDVFHLWYESSAYPSTQGLFIYFRDITERKTQENLLALEKEVLEINVQPSASLKNTVDYFLEGLERIYPGMLCSVLMLDEDKTIRHLSAPSLPTTFIDVINGTVIGPHIDSCETAMYTKQIIISANIEEDPRWESLLPAFKPFGIKSSWAFPIMNIQNEVMATISAYHKFPKSPDEKALRVLERISNLLRIIMVNKKSEETIRLSNERYLFITKATNDAIWDWDVVSNRLYWGEGFYNLFGYQQGSIDNTVKFWEERLHVEDRARIIKSIHDFFDNNKSTIWSNEYRFQKADGSYVLVHDRGFVIYNNEGVINRMVGSMQDITEKREMENLLLKQQLSKQQLIAQAVVDAQEKERADIGKELHDNVNQILSTARLYLDLARSDEKERLNLIKRSTDNIFNAINEIRNISRSLVPGSIGDLGIIESINDLVESIRATKQLHVEFYYEGAVDKLLDEKEKLMLFRIIQEQVNNVLKHAQASNLIIELMVDDDAIDLTISDNGQGFDPGNIKNKKGVGLYNISSRTELFNGKVNIVTSPGNGCKLNIHVPILNL